MTSADRHWCAGWIAGFVAFAFLSRGSIKDYERDRDEYLARKGWKPKEGHP